MKNNGKGIAVYLLLAFAISWSSLAAASWLGLSVGTRLFQLATLPALFAPAVAAVVVRRSVTREGFSDAGLALNLRKKWPYYLCAWFFPSVAVLMVIVLAAALGARLPSPVPPGVLLGLPGLPIQFIIGSLIRAPLAWGEEFGWRGYLQVRLLAHRPVLAAVTTGLFWSLWHSPAYLRGFELRGEFVLALLMLPVTTVLGSIVLGWLRLRTGSVWAAALYHSANNAAVGSPTVSTLLLVMTGRDWNWLYVSWLLYSVPVGALCAWIVLTGQLRAQAIQGQAS